MQYKRPNSIIVKDNDLGNGVKNKVIHVRGRYPKNGYRCDGAKSNIVYAMKGSGKLSTRLQESDLRPGKAIAIKPGECYYLKGQFALYFIAA